MSQYAYIATPRTLHMRMMVAEELTSRLQFRKAHMAVVVLVHPAPIQPSGINDAGQNRAKSAADKI